MSPPTFVTLAMALLLAVTQSPVHVGAKRINATRTTRNLRGNGVAELLCICGSESSGYSVARELFESSCKCADACRKTCWDNFKITAFHDPYLGIEQGCVSYSELMDMSERHAASLEQERKHRQKAIELESLGGAVNEIYSAEEELKKGITTISEKQTQQKGELASLKKQEQDLPAEIGKQEGNMEEDQNALKALQDQQEKLPKAIADAKQAEKQADMALQSLKTREEVALPRMIAEEQGLVKAKEDLVTKTAKALSTTEAEAAEAMRIKKHLQDEVDELSKTVEELKRELALKEDKLKQTETQVAQKSADEEELKKKSAELHQLLESKQVELKNLEEKELNLHKELKVTQSQRGELQEKLKEASGDRSCLEKQLSDVQIERKTIENELVKISEQHAQLNHQLELCHTQQNTVEGQLKDLQAQKDKQIIDLAKYSVSRETREAQFKKLEASASASNHTVRVVKIAMNATSGGHLVGTLSMNLAAPSTEQLAVVPALVGAVRAAAAQGSDEICCMCGGPGDTSVFSGGESFNSMELCKTGCATKCREGGGQIEPLWKNTNGCVKENEISKSIGAGDGSKFGVKFHMMAWWGDFC